MVCEAVVYGVAVCCVVVSDVGDLDFSSNASIRTLIALIIAIICAICAFFWSPI